MNGLTIINQNGTLLVDSREVAERTGKKHSHLMRDIQGYINILNPNPKLDSANFFIVSNYKDSNNQERPCFLLTRKGCDMVANKMTGEKGILFTAEYVTQFENMEQSQKRIGNKSPMELLELEFAALKETKQEVKEVKEEVKDIKENSPLFNIECEELQNALKRRGTQILGGKSSKAYKDKSLRTKLYSDMQREIKRQFGLHSYKALKRKQLDAALQIIESYSAPIIIQDDIELLNRQVEFAS